nr:RNA pseudouridine synthase 1 [Nicotiana tomentosiformis]
MVLGEERNEVHGPLGTYGWANVSELHLANRLDRDTSGVMLITKLHKVAAKFVKAFTDHKVRKTYLAFCVGLAPKWEKITVKSGHGRSKYGAWRVYAASDVGRKLPGGSLVKHMETSFEVLSVNSGCLKEVSDLQKDEAVVIVQEKSAIGCDLKNDEILVRASPQSGRTHQIRLHCQYLGIPIRGDVRYEGVYDWKGSRYDGHDLHAESLSFEHPITGKPILLQAPPPSWAIQPLRSQFE